MPHRYRRVAASELRPGMIVKAPKWVMVYDYDKDKSVRTPLKKEWPEAPAELRVVRWDLEDGESLLRALRGSGGIDYNTADYPPTFMVRATSAPKAKARDRRRNSRTALDRRAAGKKQSIGAHLSRATRSPF